MTIQEFYNWACERTIENFNILIKFGDDIYDLDDNCFDISIKDEEILIN